MSHHQKAITFKFAIFNSFVTHKKSSVENNGYLTAIQN